MITINSSPATDQPARNPLHCILVLDVSGSMDSSATENVAGGSQESAVNFTRLDLAKHSSKVKMHENSYGVLGSDLFVI